MTDSLEGGAAPQAEAPSSTEDSQPSSKGGEKDANAAAAEGHNVAAKLQADLDQLADNPNAFDEELRAFVGDRDTQSNSSETTAQDEEAIKGTQDILSSKQPEPGSPEAELAAINNGTAPEAPPEPTPEERNTVEVNQARDDTNTKDVDTDTKDKSSERDYAVPTIEPATTMPDGEPATAIIPTDQGSVNLDPDNLVPPAESAQYKQSVQDADTPAARTTLTERFKARVAEMRAKRHENKATKAETKASKVQAKADKAQGKADKAREIASRARTHAESYKTTAPIPDPERTAAIPDADKPQTPEEKQKKELGDELKKLGITPDSEAGKKLFDLVAQNPEQGLDIVKATQEYNKLVGPEAAGKGAEATAKALGEEISKAEKSGDSAKAKLLKILQAILAGIALALIHGGETMVTAGEKIKPN